MTRLKSVVSPHDDVQSWENCLCVEDDARRRRMMSVLLPPPSLVGMIAPSCIPVSRCAFSTQRGDIDMLKCNTVEDLVHLAYDHLDTISPGGIEAFWPSLAKHVQYHRGGNSRAQLNEQLTKILCNTLESMYKFDGRDIATIAISLAKVVKQVESRGQRADTGSLHRILHNLLVGINSKNKHYIFSKIAVHAIPILSEFDVRHLSNLIYSFGFAECDPKVKDGRTILDVLALEAMSKLNHFNYYSFGGYS